jgi:hypothetical protein
MPLPGILQQPLELLPGLAAMFLLQQQQQQLTGHPTAASTATLCLQVMLQLFDLHSSRTAKAAAEAPAGSAPMSTSSSSSSGGHVLSMEEARQLLNPTAELPAVLQFSRAAVAASNQLLPLLLQDVVPAAAGIMQQGQAGEGWAAALPAEERQQQLAALRAGLGSLVMLAVLAGAQPRLYSVDSCASALTWQLCIAGSGCGAWC